MSHNIWQGKNVQLRAMEQEDWEVFHKNDEDAEEARLCYEIPFPRSSAGARKWAAEVAQTPPHNDVYRLVIESAPGEVVGTLNTMACDRRCGTFKYGIAIFRPHWRKGYASEAIRLLLRYYFQELGYQKVTVHVYAFNDASLKLHQKLGFQIEGRLRRMIYTNGAYHDEYVLGLTSDEFVFDGASSERQ
ncbi:MAG: GNAT family N-acetyltransferase [Chloroflexi bacterium]|nr:GNAT family N-acetyltransferase [Chloroflexota bacterium]